MSAMDLALRRINWSFDTLRLVLSLDVTFQHEACTLQARVTISRIGPCQLPVLNPLVKDAIAHLEFTFEL